MKKYDILLSIIICFVNIPVMESSQNAEALALVLAKQTEELKSHISNTFFMSGNKIIVGNWSGMEVMKDTLKNSLICYKNRIKSEGFVLLANNMQFSTPSVQVCCFCFTKRPGMSAGSDGYDFFNSRDFFHQLGIETDSRRVDNGCRLAIYCIHETALNHIPQWKHEKEIDVLCEESEEKGLPLLFFVDENVWHTGHAVINLIKTKCFNTVYLEGSRITIGAAEKVESVKEEKKEEEKSTHNEIGELTKELDSFHFSPANVSNNNNNNNNTALVSSVDSNNVNNTSNPSSSNEPGPRRRDLSW